MAHIRIYIYTHTHTPMSWFREILSFQLGVGRKKNELQEGEKIQFYTIYLYIIVYILFLRYLLY